MTPAPALPVTYHGLLHEPERYPDVKDPFSVVEPGAITAALVDAKPSEKASVTADLGSLALPA